MFIARGKNYRPCHRCTNLHRSVAILVAAIDSGKPLELIAFESQDIYLVLVPAQLKRKLDVNYIHHESEV